ncbi:MAG: D-alanine--D-alanine ligase [Vicinamibacteria bacterium]
MSRRLRVGVLLGGASSERDISLASGKMIAEHLPRERYDVVMLDTLALMAENPRLPAALAGQARALLAGGAHDALDAREGELPEAFRSEMRRAAEQALPATEAIVATGGRAKIDVAFLALHGRYGEDGTLQGLLEILGVPYVGSGTLASALAMDKPMAKTVLAAAGIPVPAGALVERAAFAREREAVLAAARAWLPAVVKPACEGSSIGMSLVERGEQLGPALQEAFRFDRRALVEERLAGTEITVGVVGNRELQALPVVEIVPKRAFFDYRAKYDPSLSEEICPARIPPAAAESARDLALRAHRALGCRGLSRSDFILTAERGPVLLELNTMPGMTVNSLLPKAARAAGIAFPDLLERLIALALEPEG